MDVAELATAVSSSRLQPQAIHPAPSVPDKERPWKIISIDHCVAQQLRQNYTAARRHHGSALVVSHSDPTTAAWSGASTPPNATGLVANRGRLDNWARFITPAGLGSQYRSSPDVALTAHAIGWFSKLPLHHLTILHTILSALADVAFLLRVLLGTQWGRQTTMQAAEGVHMMSLCLSSLERAREVTRFTLALHNTSSPVPLF